MPIVSKDNGRPGGTWTAAYLDIHFVVRAQDGYHFGGIRDASYKGVQGIGNEVRGGDSWYYLASTGSACKGRGDGEVLKMHVCGWFGIAM